MTEAAFPEQWITALGMVRLRGWHVSLDDAASRVRSVVLRIPMRDGAGIFAYAIARDPQGLRALIEHLAHPPPLSVSCGDAGWVDLGKEYDKNTRPLA